MKKILIALVTATVLLGGAFFAGAYFEPFSFDREETYDTTQIYGQIESCSELVTAKESCYTFVPWETDGIKYLTKKECTLFCSATVEARYDLSNVHVECSESGISIDLPKAPVHQFTIDEVKYLEQKNGLFSDRDLDDSEEARKYAESQLTGQYDYTALDAAAKEQLEKTLSAVLKDAAPGGTIQYEYVL